MADLRQLTGEKGCVMMGNLKKWSLIATAILIANVLWGVLMLGVLWLAGSVVVSFESLSWRSVFDSAQGRLTVAILWFIIMAKVAAVNEPRGSTND